MRPVMGMSADVTVAAPTAAPEIDDGTTARASILELTFSTGFSPVPSTTTDCREHGTTADPPRRAKRRLNVSPLHARGLEARAAALSSRLPHLRTARKVARDARVREAEETGRFLLGL